MESSKLTSVRKSATFEPSPNADPKRLTRAQIGSFNDNGFLTPLDVFTPEEALRNREYINWFLKSREKEPNGTDAFGLNSYHVTCETLWRMIMNPIALDYCEDLLGPNLVVVGSTFWCKEPGNPKAVPWHQDGVNLPIDPTGSINVWLAIDDVDEENGAVQFVPGTHRRGRLPWDFIDPAVVGPVVAPVSISTPDQYGKPVGSTLKAGQVSIHSDLTMHGSPPNRSNRRRCGIAFLVCRPEIRPIEPAFGVNAVIARGADTHGHWVHNPCPTGEDTRTPESCRASPMEQATSMVRKVRERVARDRHTAPAFFDAFERQVNLLCERHRNDGQNLAFALISLTRRELGYNGFA